MLDWDPQAVVLPYHHSNVQSEEVMYYVEGDYAARKGVEIGSFTLHPSGLPHGPQPGTVEKTLGMTRTDELAVMCDTFRPLKLTTLARDLDDPSYAYSWYEDPGACVVHLGRRRADDPLRARPTDAVAQLGGPGYTLLTTPRAAAAAPWIAAAAGAVHEVGRGQVHELAGGLLATVSGDRLVALGGGRVVDVAKALAAAARAGRRAGQRRARAARCARWPSRPRCRARR